MIGFKDHSLTSDFRTQGAALGFQVQVNPNLTCNPKTYLFMELYREAIITDPKKAGIFGYRQALNSYRVEDLRFEGTVSSVFSALGGPSRT